VAGDYTPHSAVDIFVKDMGIVTDTALAADAPAPLSETALKLFRAASAEALPVVAAAKDRRVVGYLTEAYALRRYAHELERRRGLADEAGLFSPAPPSQP